VDQRIKRLEARINRPKAPRWEAVREAQERFALRTRAKVRALLEGREPPAEDEQAAADADLIRRWHEAHGRDAEPDAARLREELARRLGGARSERGEREC
jgi:hypothetical protein